MDEFEHPDWRVDSARPEPPAPAPYSYGPPPGPHPVPPSPPSVPVRAERVRRAGGLAVFFAGLAGAVIGAGVVAAAVLLVLVPTSRTESPAPTTTVSTVEPGATLSTQPIEAAAADVLPSVVNVAVASATGSGVGSGVIISSDGLILTNYHVIEGAQTITVHVGTASVAANVVGTDPTSDLAVIKVAKTGLTAARIGDSAGLVIGETVLAVGSPFGLEKTVTSGIVSALHRSNVIQGMSGVTAYSDLIQTDAAINPGNSGGALVDISGAVVGLNTLIESPTGQVGASQSAGIGFAIPIDYAMSVAQQLVAGKHVTHPYMGVTAMSVDGAVARWYGLPVDTGALVTQVSSGSPASRAHLQPGDTIVAMGGVTIASADELYMQQLKANVGAPITLKIVHSNGVDATVTITLVAR